MTESLYRFAVVQAGTVFNIAQSSRQYAGTQTGWIESEDAQIGDTYADGIFIHTPVAPFVPQIVTRRQARQALLLSGLLDKVQAKIDVIPDAIQRGLIQIEWDDSLNFERQRPALIALAAAMGLNDAALDQLFTLAESLA